jgi:hypothetical protein
MRNVHILHFAAAVTAITRQESAMLPPRHWVTRVCAQLVRKPVRQTLHSRLFHVLGCGGILMPSVICR